MRGRGVPTSTSSSDALIKYNLKIGVHNGCLAYRSDFRWPMCHALHFFLSSALKAVLQNVVGTQGNC